MRVAIIITTFNWPESLSLVLQSIEIQSRIPDEIIIADDGSDKETEILVSAFMKNSKLNIIHSWQINKGFRAAQSRNRAIAKSKADYIILIDGDMVLHKNFVHDHCSSAEKNTFIQGGRVLLTSELTQKKLMIKNIFFSFFSVGLQNRKNALHSDFLSLLFSRKRKDIKGIKTCNMSFFKEDCIKINGFNNDFIDWGREDSEFAVRLLNSGVIRKNLRFNGIQFHLHHTENKNVSLKRNDLILNESIKNKSVWCNNGINNYL